MLDPIPARRLYCAACLRPQTACICGCVQTVASQVEVLILQHPNEVQHAKGTARLLHLCLPNSRLMAGEIFDETALHQLLYADNKTPVLLYPRQNEAQAAFDDSTLPNNIRLVVLDATWQNSRRLLRLNPALHALPCVAFQNPAPTRYRAIRIAYAPHQLSTLEATGAMLAQLDAGLNTHPLLTAFDAFIALQQTFLPAVRRMRQQR